MAAFGRRLPAQEPIGESWELYDDAGGSARVAEGPARGLSLRELSEEWGDALVGPGHPGWRRRFPLLIKYLDAHEDLSVQVHPDDSLAAALEGPGVLGKHELWVVMDCPAGSRLLSGFKPGVDTAAFKEALERGSVGALLNSVEVSPGDVVDTPAGRVHALGAGCLVAEVQQNSDVTYRVWDYGRRDHGAPRPLHVAQALRALRFDAPFAQDSGLLHAPARGPQWEGEQTLVTGPSFEVRRLWLRRERRFVPTGFPRILMALHGGLRLAWGAGQGMMVPWGGTVLVPAALDFSASTPADESVLLLIEPR
jgi:mannose-6-phosphate isomerase